MIKYTEIENLNGKILQKQSLDEKKFKIMKIE